MAKTRSELKTMCVRYGHIPDDSIFRGGIDEDLAIACNIVAGKKDWPQLYKTNTISLTASDGDIDYSLATDVDEIEQMRITSPSSYARVIPPISKERLREVIPDKTIPGTAVPSMWYFSEPTISSVNVETKNVSFNYRPDQAYTITYSYKKFAPALDADGKYPFFDETYHHILAYYALWKYAERSADAAVNPIYWRNEWLSALAEMQADEQSQLKYPLEIPYDDTL